MEQVSAGGAGYFAADAEASDELVRLRRIEAEFDQHTLRYLRAVGVGEGWRCLEVGAGAGSVVRWLSGRVGPAGWVVAADIDPRFVGDLREPNIEVRRCDITRDDVESAAYDLVHSRLLLMHLDDPAEVLARMVATLRPGGWLVVEEFDGGDLVGSVDPAHPLAEAFDNTFRKAHKFLLAAGIMDNWIGRVLPAHMDALALVDMGNVAISRVGRGGDPFSRWWIQSLRVAKDPLIANGAVTEAELADTLRALEDPTFRYRPYLMQSVWGRKPQRA